MKARLLKSRFVWTVAVCAVVVSRASASAGPLSGSPAVVTTVGQLVKVLATDVGVPLVSSVASDGTLIIKPASSGSICVGQLVGAAIARAHAAGGFVSGVPAQLQGTGALCVSSLTAQFDQNNNFLTTQVPITLAGGQSVTMQAYVFLRSDGNAGYVLGFNGLSVLFGSVASYLAPLDAIFSTTGFVLATDDWSLMPLLGAEQVHVGMNVLAQSQKQGWVYEHFLSPLGMPQATVVADFPVSRADGTRLPRMAFFDPALHAVGGLCWNAAVLGPISILGLSGAPGQVFGPLGFACLKNATTGISFDDNGLAVLYLDGTDSKTGWRADVQFIEQNSWRMAHLTDGATPDNLLQSQFVDGNAFDTIAAIISLNSGVASFSQLCAGNDDCNTTLGFLDDIATPGSVELSLISGTGLAAEFVANPSISSSLTGPGIGVTAAHVDYANRVVTGFSSQLSSSGLGSSMYAQGGLGAAIYGGLTLKMPDAGDLGKKFENLLGFNQLRLQITVGTGASSFTKDSSIYVTAGDPFNPVKICLDALAQAGILPELPPTVTGVLGGDLSKVCLELTGYRFKKTAKMHLQATGQTSPSAFMFTFDVELPTMLPYLKLLFPMSMSLGSLLPAAMTGFVDATVTDPQILFSLQKPTRGVSFAGTMDFGGVLGDALALIKLMRLPDLNKAYALVNIPVGGGGTGFKIGAEKTFAPAYDPFAGLLKIDTASFFTTMGDPLHGTPPSVIFGFDSVLNIPLINKSYAMVLNAQMSGAAAGKAPELALTGQIRCDDQGVCPTIGFGSPFPLQVNLLAVPDVPIVVKLHMVNGVPAGFGFAGTAQVGDLDTRAIFDFNLNDPTKSGLALWVDKPICLTDLPGLSTSLLGAAGISVSLPSVNLFCLEPAGPVPQPTDDPYTFGAPLISAAIQGVSIGNVHIPAGLSINGKVAAPGASGTAEIHVVPPSLANLAGLDPSVEGITAHVKVDQLCPTDLIGLVNGLTGLGIPTAQLLQFECLKNVDISVVWTPTMLGMVSNVAALSAPPIPSITISGQMTFFGLNAVQVSGTADQDGLFLNASLADVSIGDLFSMHSPQVTLKFSKNDQSLSLVGDINIAGIVRGQGRATQTLTGWRVVASLAGGSLAVTAGLVAGAADAQAEYSLDLGGLNALTGLVNAALKTAVAQALGQVEGVFQHAQATVNKIQSRCNALPSAISSVCDDMLADANAAFAIEQASYNALVNIVQNFPSVTIDSLVFSGDLDAFKKGATAHAAVTYTIAGDQATVSFDSASFSDPTSIVHALGPMIASKLVDQLVAGAIAQDGALGSLLEKVAVAVAQALATEFKNVLENSAKEVVDLGLQAVDNTQALATGLSGAFETSAMLGGMSAVNQEIGDQVASALNAVGLGAVGTAITDAQQVSQTAIGLAQTAAIEAEQAANQAVQEVGQFVDGVLADVKAQVEQAVVEVAEAIADAAKAAWHSFISIF